MAEKYKITHNDEKALSAIKTAIDKFKSNKGAVDTEKLATKLYSLMEKAEMGPRTIIQAAELEDFQKLLNQGTKSKKLGTPKYTLHQGKINSFINDNSKKPQAITLTQPAKVTTAEALYENINPTYDTPASIKAPNGRGIPAEGGQTATGDPLYSEVELGAGSGEIRGVVDEPVIYSPVRPAESRNSIPDSVQAEAKAIGQNALGKNGGKSETKEDPTTRTRSATPPLPPK
jgi:hypothetical protein